MRLSPLKSPRFAVMLLRLFHYDAGGPTRWDRKKHPTRDRGGRAGKSREMKTPGNCAILVGEEIRRNEGNDRSAIEKLLFLGGRQLACVI